MAALAAMPTPMAGVLLQVNEIHELPIKLAGFARLAPSDGHSFWPRKLRTKVSGTGVLYVCMHYVEGVN